MKRCGLFENGFPLIKFHNLEPKWMSFFNIFCVSGVFRTASSVILQTWTQLNVIWAQLLSVEWRRTEASLRSVPHSDVCMCEAVSPQPLHNMEGRGGKRSAIVTKGRGEDSSSILKVLGSLFCQKHLQFRPEFAAFSLVPTAPTCKKNKKIKPIPRKEDLRMRSCGKWGTFPPNVSPFDSGNKSSVLNILKFS